MLLFKLFENDPALIIPWFAALLIAITAHEFSHGFAAFQLGDTTAQRAGRLTLNPLAHLDVLGSVLLLLVGFGWAKPVPIDLGRVRKGNLGRFLVSFAGILTNIGLAVACAFMLKALFAFSAVDPFNYLVKFLAFLVYINLSLFIFNLIPIAPLDGYRVFESMAPRAFERFAPLMEQWGFFILIALVFLTDAVGYLIALFVYLFSLVFQLPIFNLAFAGL
ncbi:site-2 protease family protein [Candidatus Azambacteria bacterium]|nr:site-2 protease family protein [Candidatus Azambacteria bacterium]MBI3685281.1 site-2 protease family protein [Candidatus Azambacteria bacterium]